MLVIFVIVCFFVVVVVVVVNVRRRSMGKYTASATAHKDAASVSSGGNGEGPRRMVSMAVTGIACFVIGYHFALLHNPPAFLAIALRRTRATTTTSVTAESIPSPSRPPRNTMPRKVDSKDDDDDDAVSANLPPGIVEKSSDLYLRRLAGIPAEDFADGAPPAHLAAFAVGIRNRDLVKRTLSRFDPRNFTIVLFHYDGVVEAWADLPWFSRAISVVAKGQTKWWFAKRFLHPDVVSRYEYIFLWDDDLRPDGFHAEGYVQVARSHGLQVSQPAMGRGSVGVTWPLTLRIENSTVHHVAPPEDRDPCTEGLTVPPCGAFVEIMAPVFAGGATWRCVWQMIQNDLVHSWGLDFALRLCVDPPAYRHIGIVDAHWVVHPGRVSLGYTSTSSANVDAKHKVNGSRDRNRGGDGHGNGAVDWSAERRAVRQRCWVEWGLFRARLRNTEAKIRSRSKST